MFILQGTHQRIVDALRRELDFERDAHARIMRRNLALAADNARLAVQVAGTSVRGARGRFTKRETA